ncbi:unnamed protein product [Urochloa humidicola]
MEATALSQCQSALDAALGYAKSTVTEKAALQLGVQSDHAFIRDELDMTRSLMDAQENRDDCKAKVFMTWVRQVRDVAYDARGTASKFWPSISTSRGAFLPRCVNDAASPSR